MSVDCGQHLVESDRLLELQSVLPQPAGDAMSPILPSNHRAFLGGGLTLPFFYSIVLAVNATDMLLSH